MKSSGEYRRSNIAETMNSMDYRSTESDSDVWIKNSTADNGTAYYNYMLMYVSYVLHLVKDSQEDMLKINQVN